jgi:hypothetical protein
MVQLWVNLPKKHKMTRPKYQAIESKEIPCVPLGNGGELRVIAGEYDGHTGPSSTYTPINVYDIRSQETNQVSLEFQKDSNTVILIMSGELELESRVYQEHSVVIFDREGETVDLKLLNGFKGLVLNGEPIDEPVVAHGPFVMNTREEIFDAINDFQQGKMGNL